MLTIDLAVARVRSGKSEVWISRCHSNMFYSAYGAVGFEIRTWTVVMSGRRSNDKGMLR